MRFCSDFAFLLRALPASFRSSANLFFSSSKSGFAVPSCSSLNLRTYSSISMASSTLYKYHEDMFKITGSISNDNWHPYFR